MQSFLFISFIISLIIVVLLFHRKYYGNNFQRKMYYWIWLIIALRLLFPIDISEKTAVYNIKSPEIKILENNIENKVPTVDENVIENIEPDKTNENINLNMDKDINKGKSIEIKRFSIINFLKDNYMKIYIVGFILYFSINIIIYLRQKSIIKEKKRTLDKELYYRFIELKEEMIPNKSLELKISDFIGSPMVMGIFKPILYIPKYTKNEELEHILRHEFIHIKRNDTIYKFILFLVRTIHWFNPVIHMMAKKAYEDIELSCDEMVVESLDREEKIAYGKTLISTIETSFYNSAFTTSFSGGKNMIKKRIDIIFNSIKKKSGRSFISLTLIIVMSTGLLISCSEVETKNMEKEFDNMVDNGVSDILKGTGNIVSGAMKMAGNIVSNVGLNRIEKVADKFEKSTENVSKKLINMGVTGKLNYKNSILLNEEYIIGENFNSMDISLLGADLELEYGSENKVEYISTKKDDRFNLEFEVSNNTLKLNEYSTSSVRKNINGKVILTLEKDIYDDIEIETYSGNINIDKLNSNKNISLENISGNINIKTINSDSIDIDISSGYINIENIISKNMEIETSSGNIEIDKIDVEEVNIDSSSGNINIINGNINKIFAESLSGNIKLNGIIKNMFLETSSGNILIEGVNKNSNINVDTSSSYITIFGNKYNEYVDIKGSNKDKIIIESSSGDIIIK